MSLLHTVHEGDPMMVLAGVGLPFGARVIGAQTGADEPLVWISVCLIGTHLPQMYRPEELHRLVADDAALYGLCQDCLGFGTAAVVAELSEPVPADQVPDPCETCDGTGRPALRCTVRRSDDGGAMEAELTVVDHEFVPAPKAFTRWRQRGMDMVVVDAARSCMGCGYQRENPIHTTPHV
jgi:hypothetical protein